MLGGRLFTPPVIPPGMGLSLSHASPPRALIAPRRSRAGLPTSPAAQRNSSGDPPEEFDDDEEGGGERGPADDLDLMYDPILNCYYDPKTNKYYELA
jgi:hypothetical protein